MTAGWILGGIVGLVAGVVIGVLLHYWYEKAMEASN